MKIGKIKIEEIKNISDIKVSVEIFENKGLMNEMESCFFNGATSGVCHEKNKIIGVPDYKEEFPELQLGNEIYEELKRKKIKRVALLFNGEEKNLLKALEGIILSAYNFNTFKTHKKDEYFLEEIFLTKEVLDMEEMKKLFYKLEAIYDARDQVNTPPNIFTPLFWTNIVERMQLNNKKISVETLGEKALEKENMNLMLNVGKASKNESKLIHISYKPKDPIGKIVLVGKGVTFDTGGISLKPSDALTNMKSDKAGGVAVMNIVNAISKIGTKYEVHGFVGAVENSVGSQAYRPDDILKSKNGKTVEILNTDAEGRLVLADVLSYAQEKVKDIDFIFDYATLTGACVVGLGEYTTGVMGENKKLIRNFVEKVKSSGEFLNPLCFNQFLRKDTIEGSIADLPNLGSSRYGGAQQAGLFLSEFIDKENQDKWLHFDIAGPAFARKNWFVNPKGGTGAGISFTLEFIKKLEEESDG